MNILILNWRDIKNPKSGGAEIVTMEHAKAWVKKGQKVAWFTSNYKNGKRKEVIDGVEIIRYGNFIMVYLLAPFFYLLSHRKFDIVIDQIHGLPFFTPLYVRKPKIILIHEIAGPIWDYMFPFPISLFGKFIEPYFFKIYKKQKFWVPSESTVDDLMSLGINKKNINLIYCGINNKVLSKPSSKEKIPTFIFVSRVVKMKGIEEVIKTFSYILKQIPDGRLWIVGDGDPKYKGKLIKVIQFYGISSKVSFFGKLPNSKKLELMRRAHLLLHASIKEGWGMVVIEAASQATPAVVYDVGGLRDSVRDNQTGIIVDENTPMEMARESLSLISDAKRYKSNQENCLNWARKFDWSKSAKESLELLKDNYKK